MGIGNSDLGMLDPGELKIVKASWNNIMADVGQNGPYIFGRFLEKYNYFSYFRRFSSIPVDQLAESTAFKDHSFLVMSAIDKLIVNSDNSEELKNDLFKLGRLHSQRNLTTQQFLELKAIIIDIMDKKFHLPRDTLIIWNKAFDICYSYVFETLEPRLSRDDTEPPSPQ